MDVQDHLDRDHPRVSVISIAPIEEKFAGVLHALECQTCQNYEFIGEVGNPVPECWNRAIARSKGEILVFLDPEARPVNECWLEELVAGVTDERMIVKGLEIVSSPLDPSSLAGHREAFVENPFDEKYLWSEDSELFCHLKENGYRFIQLLCAPVIHPGKPGSKTTLRRAFRYGLYWAKLRHRYAEPVELMSVSSVMNRMIAALLNLLGMWAGTVIFGSPKRSS